MEAAGIWFAGVGEHSEEHACGEDIDTDVHVEIPGAVEGEGTESCGDADGERTAVVREEGAAACRVIALAEREREAAPGVREEDGDGEQEADEAVVGEHLEPVIVGEDGIDVDFVPECPVGAQVAEAAFVVFVGAGSGACDGAELPLFDGALPHAGAAIEVGEDPAFAEFVFEGAGG